MKSVVIALGITVAIVASGFAIVGVLSLWIGWALYLPMPWSLIFSPIAFLGYVMLIFTFRGVLAGLRSEHAAEDEDD